jgi:hypothetical protein
MAEQEYCVNGWGKGKVIYRTKAQAEKTARRTKSGLALHTYSCRHCGGWHLTSQPQRNKPETPPLSAGKLRRKLADAAAQIKAAEKRLSTAEREYLAELAYVTTETEKIFGARK